jgi:hypothetical protein
MNRITILAMFAILAGSAIIATTGFIVIGSAQAQDNATMAGNMTAGNMTAGNLTEPIGNISNRGKA